MSQLLLPRPNLELPPLAGEPEDFDRKQGLLRVSKIVGKLADVRYVVQNVRNVILATTVPGQLTPRQTVLTSGFEPPSETAQRPHSGLKSTGHEPSEEVSVLSYGRNIWWSYPNTLHSRILARNPYCSLAVYSSDENMPGLTMEAQARALSFDETALFGLAAFNAIRSKRGIAERHLAEFDPDQPRRRGIHQKVLYVADPIPGTMTVGVPLEAPQGARFEHVDDHRVSLTPEQIWGGQPYEYQPVTKQMTNILLRDLIHH